MAPPKGSPKSGGRVKGTPNKITASLKEAIMLAAEQTGRDGKGQDGVTGYCQYLAVSEPKAFAQLIGKVLPMQVAGDPNNPVQLMIVTGVPRAGDD